MAVLISVFNGDLVVPTSVTDLPSFQSWFRSKDFPAIGKVMYYDGNIWIDPSSQQVLHCHVKSSLAAAIGGWIRHKNIGMTLCDGLRFTNEGADLSTEPDVMFFTEASLLSGKVKMMDGDASLEVEGSPEIIVEVISPTSVKKDEKTLREKYWEAGVQENWLAESRKVPSLSILKRTARGFVTVKANAQGWLRSEVLGALCRLVCKPGPAATTKVELEMKTQ